MNAMLKYCLCVVALGMNILLAQESAGPIAPAPSDTSTITPAPSEENTAKKKMPRQGATSKIIKTEPQQQSNLTPEQILEFAKKVNEQIEKIKDIAPENYIREVEQYRTQVENFVEQKKRVCNGEFTTSALGDFSGTVTRRKLNQDERRSCFKELKSLQENFINTMYKARKSYLEYLHETRLKELEENRDKALKGLQSSFNR